MRKSSFLYCLIITALVFVLFRDSLTFYAVGDIASWLHRYQFDFASIFTEKTNNFHYHPLSLLWIGLPLSLFGFDTFWIQLNLLVAHAFNACLVFLLAKIILEKTSHALCATVLFCAGFCVTGAIIANPPNTAAALLLLVCFFLFRAHLISGLKPALIFCCFTFAASVFVFLTAVNFLVVHVFYFMFDPEKMCGGIGNGASPNSSLACFDYLRLLCSCRYCCSLPVSGSTWGRAAIP